jgi:transposase-like protein
MAGPRKRHPAAFQAKVALEAVKQTRTLAELSRIFQVYPVQISQWKKQLRDGVESLFGDGRRREHDAGLTISSAEGTVALRRRGNRRPPGDEKREHGETGTVSRYTGAIARITAFAPVAAP